MGKLTMNDQTPGWSKHKRLRGQLFFLVAGYLRTAMIVLILSRPHAILSGSINYVFAFMNVCWLVAVCFVALRLRNWPCPRCGKRYSEQLDLGILTRRCAPCELPKSSNSSVA